MTRVRGACDPTGFGSDVLGAMSPDAPSVGVAYRGVVWPIATPRSEQGDPLARAGLAARQPPISRNSSGPRRASERTESRSRRVASGQLPVEHDTLAVIT